MWVRSAAIRPVPAYAQLPPEVFAEVEQWLGSDEAAAEQRLHEAFERFESEQAVLADRIGSALARTSDEVAIALGYFLALAIWLAFAQHRDGTLRTITETAVTSVEEALALDEELRGADPAEGVDSDDVVAMEQPHVLNFVNEHVEAALEVHVGEVDVEAVHAMYRLILVEVLALSYAVPPPDDATVATGEIEA
ncbi:MAG: hypothetical protein DRI90_21725 [Deltaproteobacteria bacterium]|nr:MAG: hypothetical protein DRI90_21725 [Deltaproteobacteria bacterium]